MKYILLYIIKIKLNQSFINNKKNKMEGEKKKFDKN